VISELVTDQRHDKSKSTFYK